MPHHVLPQPLCRVVLAFYASQYQIHWYARQLFNLHRTHLSAFFLLSHVPLDSSLTPMPQFSQYYQRVKNVIHAVQALAIFVAWAIIIAILTKRGRIDGRVWYNFALVSSSKAFTLPRCKN